MFRSLHRALLFAAAGLPSVAGAQVTSTFDTDADGWRVVGFLYSHIAAPGMVPVAWDANIGLPPGSLSAWDQYGETGVAAPEKFLGDKSASFGELLSFDILLAYSDGVTYPAVILNAGAFSLYYNLPSTAVGAWEHRTVPLTQDGWRYNSWTGPDATEAQMRQALSALVGLYINTEWHTGADDTHVDNVVLGGLVCDPDVNCDGVPDQGDVACIILAVAGDMSCYCQADPDYNRDGVPDQGDVADLILSVAGAPCP